MSFVDDLQDLFSFVCVSDCNLAELKAVIEWKDAVMTDKSQSKFSKAIRLFPTGKELAAQVSKAQLSMKDDELLDQKLCELRAITWDSPDCINTAISISAPALVGFKQDAATYYSPC